MLERNYGANLGSGIPMAEEVEQSSPGDIKPNRSCENNGCTWRLSSFSHVILHHDSHVWGMSHLGPRIVCGGTHVSTKCFHHSICQLQQTGLPHLCYKNCSHQKKQASLMEAVKHAIN